MPESIQEKASILVVDDNPLIVNVLKSLLGSVNYTVFCSSNGNEALDILSSKSIDVIVCDVMMPHMDGYDLHEQVRQRSELSHIPFVFLTALSSEDERKEGKLVGADDYLVKPFDPTELLAVVQGKVKRSKHLRNMSEQQYDSYRKRVIHTLSHEFRTPLVAINTGTELLLEQDGTIENPKVANLLQAIQRGGQRLEKLVNDFMLLQQIEAGIAARLFDSRHRIRDLVKVVEDFADATRKEIEDQGFVLSSDIASPATLVDIYEPQILDILNRFISNSVKFHKGQKEIELQVYPLAEEVAIEVRDRGIGLDIDKVNEAIDVFGQIDRDRLEQQGGGLGLAIANRYASINYGRLEFENRKEGGAVARLILPTCKEQNKA